MIVNAKYIKDFKTMSEYIKYTEKGIGKIL